MKSLLVISPLDYKWEANQRVHYIVRYLGKRFNKVVVICFKMPNNSSFRAWFKDSLFIRIRSSEEDNIRFIEVNPFINWPESLGKKLSGFPNVTASSSPFSWKAFLSKGLNLLGLTKAILFIISYLLVSFTRLRGRVFDVCVVEGALTGIVGLLIRRAGRTRLLICEDCDYTPGDLPSRLRTRLTAWLEKHCMERADLVISAGEMLGELRRSQIKNKNIVVIPNGVHHERFFVAQKKRPHPPTLVYMGNITDWTGLDFTISVLPKICEKLRDVRLLIIGHGYPQYIIKLKQMVEGLDLVDHVKFLGFKSYEELPYCLKEADLGLANFRPIPLLIYAYPLKVLEYMAAGLPVIGTKGTETEKMLLKFRSGVAIDFGDEEALCNSITSLLIDRIRYKEYSENAKRWARDLSWDKAMEKEYHYIKDRFETLVTRKILSA